MDSVSGPTMSGKTQGKTYFVFQDFACTHQVKIVNRQKVATLL